MFKNKTIKEPSKPLGYPHTFSDLSYCLEEFFSNEKDKESKLCSHYTWNELLDLIDCEIKRCFDGEYGLGWDAINDHINNKIEELLKELN